jgi:ribosomal protein L37E
MTFLSPSRAATSFRLNVHQPNSNLNPTLSHSLPRISPDRALILLSSNTGRRAGRRLPVARKQVGRHSQTNSPVEGSPSKGKKKKRPNSHTHARHPGSSAYESFCSVCRFFAPKAKTTKKRHFRMRPLLAHPQVEGGKYGSTLYYQ